MDLLLKSVSVVDRSQSSLPQIVNWYSEYSLASDFKVFRAQYEGSSPAERHTPTVTFCA